MCHSWLVTSRRSSPQGVPPVPSPGAGAFRALLILGTAKSTVDHVRDDRPRPPQCFGDIPTPSLGFLVPSLVARLLIEPGRP